MAERLRLLETDRIVLDLGSERGTLILTEDYIRGHFSSGGVIPVTPDGKHVLLGGHRVGRSLLWGPFAGKKEGEEKPEDTALREAKEEGLPSLNICKLPVVLVNCMEGVPKIGVVYPIVLDYDSNLGQPGVEEIEQIRPFSWGGLTELMDEADPTVRLWGSGYTYILLQWVINILVANPSQPGEVIASRLGMVCWVRSIFGRYGSTTPYDIMRMNVRKP